MSSSQTSMPTLDLHGCRRSDAIRQLTDFLERHRSCSSVVDCHDNPRVGLAATSLQQSPLPSWVCIITGTGSHSKDGPVLRDATLELLMKRHMVFSINRGRGSITVDANSGIVLHKAPVVETKLLIWSRTDRRIASLSSSRTVTPGRALQVALPKLLGDQERQLSSSCQGVAPSRQPQDVEILARAVVESTRDYQVDQKCRADESQILKAALQRSAAAVAREEELKTREDELLQRTLAQSAADLERELKEQAEEEECLLQELLVKSATEIESQHQDLSHLEEDTILQEVLAKSAAEFEAHRQQDSIYREEDVILQEVLSTSRAEFEMTRQHGPPQPSMEEDAILQELLAKSAVEFELQKQQQHAEFEFPTLLLNSESEPRLDAMEDEELRRALERSLRNL